MLTTFVTLAALTLKEVTLNGLTIKAGFLFYPYMIASLRNYLFIFNLYLHVNA